MCRVQSKDFNSQDYVYNPAKVIGSEDCLYLNVYTKRGMAGDDATLKKVMFYIHGGAFIFGGAQGYPATYFLEEDVVLVSFWNGHVKTGIDFFIQKMQDFVILLFSHLCIRGLFFFNFRLFNKQST